jgi:hypothetical protein
MLPARSATTEFSQLIPVFHFRQQSSPFPIAVSERHWIWPKRLITNKVFGFGLRYREFLSLEQWCRPRVCVPILDGRILFAFHVLNGSCEISCGETNSTALSIHGHREFPGHHIRHNKHRQEHVSGR